MPFKLAFDQMMDVLLRYHRDHCRAMHTSREQTAYQESFFKAEATREILTKLSMQLDEKDQKAFRENIARKIAAMQESMFFGKGGING